MHTVKSSSMSKTFHWSRLFWSIWGLSSQTYLIPKDLIWAPFWKENKSKHQGSMKKKTSNGLSIKFPCLKEGKLIACKFIIQLRHFQWDLCHPAVDTTGRAVITQAPLLHSRKALPPLCGGRRGLWVVRLLLGCMKTSLVVLSQHVLVLPCLIPMVLSPKPCPVVSHSCGSMWMDYPIQSFMIANPLVGRIHSFPWKKVIGSSNE